MWGGGGGRGIIDGFKYGFPLHYSGPQSSVYQTTSRNHFTKNNNNKELEQRIGGPFNPPPPPPHDYFAVIYNWIVPKKKTRENTNLYIICLNHRAIR